MSHASDGGAEPALTPELEQRLRRMSECRTRLLGSVRVHDLLALLSDFGLGDDDIASALPDVSERSVRRWRTAGPPSSKASARWRQLDDLRTIVGFLLADGTYDEQGIVSWLRSRHDDLRLRRPLDALAEGGFDDVLAAAESSVASRPRHDDDAVGPPVPATPESIVARASR